MPYHTDTKKKVVKMPKPLNKPSKTLNKIQKDYMKEHSKKHSKEHNNYMIKMMKRGMCIEQSHKLALKVVGK
jgi:hypothetical protein